MVATGPQKPWTPAFAWVGLGPTSTHIAMVLHGIWGSGRNLRSFCQGLAAQLPQWSLLLVDLRNHGESTGAPAPHTVSACAADIFHLCQHLGVAPSALVGHSFGGKVAMEVLADPWPHLRQIIVLDTLPHLRASEDDGPAAIAKVLAALRSVPQPLAQRGDVVPLLLACGLDTSVAQWMTTNLRADGDGYRFKFDLDGVEAMLQSYFASDSWPLLRQVPPTITVDVVRAALSPRWTPEVVAAFAELPVQVRLHVLADAGHWLHVDNPLGLTRLMVALLQPCAAVRP